MSSMTPMMRQYFEIKNKYPDTLVFYRLGDFYELFFDDARKASALLDLTLTRRGTNNGEPIPMAGIPFHAADGYFARLIKAGQSAVVCEQAENPQNSKGMMLRKISRILTPGTVTDEGVAPDSTDNLIACVYKGKRYYALSWLSLSSGLFKVSVAADLRQIQLYLDKIHPAELVFPENFKEQTKLTGCTCTHRLPAWYFVLKTCYSALCEQFHTESLIGYDLENIEDGICAAGALLSYVKDTQNVSLSHVRSILRDENSDFVILDHCAQRNLELLQNLRGERFGSLLSVLDKTCTPMGSRLLRRFIVEPLRDDSRVQERLDCVQGLLDSDLMEQLGSVLAGCGDTERAVARIALLSARPRDLVLLRQTMQKIPEVRKVLQEAGKPALHNLADRLNAACLPQLLQLLTQAIAQDPSTFIRDGGVMAPGYNQELDTLRDLMSGSQETLSAIEQREKERTGISSLKVAFNQVHGYYIEISKIHAHNVPAVYQRRQTLKNSERYITPELKELEEKTLTAQARALALEKTLFEELLRQLQQYIQELTALSRNLAFLDVMNSFAAVAAEHHYVRPQLCQGAEISVEGGRHPVIESLNSGVFVENDVTFSPHKVLIISGPNMGGKSTFMRQTALIAIMARAGSFVPARKAVIGSIDRIFTRIGASDDLASGRSTFMVEMEETASILNNATSRSLVLLDEVGRGTSTAEGEAIAKAIAQYICLHINALTMFSTHYTAIPHLSSDFAQVKNLCFKAEEKAGRIVFLHHAEEGFQSYSYGIEVGKLAGLPYEVIALSKTFLQDILQHRAIVQAKPAEGKATQAEAAKQTEQEEQSLPQEKQAETAVPAAATAEAEVHEVNETNEVQANGTAQTAEPVQSAEPAEQSVPGVQNVQPVPEPVGAQEKEVLQLLQQQDLNSCTPLQALTLLYSLQQKLRQ